MNDKKMIPCQFLNIFCFVKIAWSPRGHRGAHQLLLKTNLVFFKMPTNE